MASAPFRTEAPLMVGLRSLHLASLAKDALVAEAELTPKPGLVDRRGPGAHTDLSIGIMRRSARAVEPFFGKIAAAAADSPMDESLRAALGAIGRDAEAAMFEATGGSNSHKGGIWTLGLLIAAAGNQGETSPARVADLAKQLARLPDLTGFRPVSHGEAVYVRYGATGARGEASAGFPHVVHAGLPALAAARAVGLTEEESRLHALLHIMASLDDTCVLYRGGVEGLLFVQEGARSVLDAGGLASEAGREAFRRLDRELPVRGISPGGSADLLAATLFLDALRDDRLPRETYGAH